MSNNSYSNNIKSYESNDDSYDAGFTYGFFCGIFVTALIGIGYYRYYSKKK